MTDENAPIIRRIDDDQATSLVGGDQLRRSDGQLTDQPIAEHSTEADEHVLAVRASGTTELEKASAFNAARCTTCGHWHVTDCPACCQKQPMARCICRDESQQRHPKKQLQDAVLALSERIKAEPLVEIKQDEALDALAQCKVLQAENGALRTQIAALQRGLEETTKQATAFELTLQDITKKFNAAQRRDAVSEATWNAIQKELQTARADVAAARYEQDEAVRKAVKPWEADLKTARARIVNLEGQVEALQRNLNLAQDEAEELRGKA